MDFQDSNKHWELMLSSVGRMFLLDSQLALTAVVRNSPAITAQPPSCPLRRETQQYCIKFRKLLLDHCWHLLYNRTVMKNLITVICNILKYILGLCLLSIPPFQEKILTLFLSHRLNVLVIVFAKHRSLHAEVPPPCSPFRRNPRFYSWPVAFLLPLYRLHILITARVVLCFHFW